MISTALPIHAGRLDPDRRKIQKHTSHAKKKAADLSTAFLMKIAKTGNYQFGCHDRPVFDQFGCRKGSRNPWQVRTAVGLRILQIFVFALLLINWQKKKGPASTVPLMLFAVR
jgi:hypothetical protein